MPKVYPATAAKKAQEASGDAALLATTWKDKIKAADAGECHLTSIDSAKIEALSASEKKKLLKVAFQEQRPGWIRVLYAAGACAHDALLLAIVGRQRGTAEMLYKEYNVDVGGIPTADELRNDDGTDPDLPPYQLAHNNDMPEVAEEHPQRRMNRKTRSTHRRERWDSDGDQMLSPEQQHRQCCCCRQP